MPIQISENNPTVRECKADYEYTNDKGKLVTEQITVKYRDRTIADMKKAMVEAEARRKKAESGETTATEAFPWLSAQLAAIVVELPDLVEAGKPIEISEENLDKLSIVNLRSIEAAIEADVRPKSQPSS